MTSMLALCARIASWRSSGPTYCVISADRARSNGIWTPVRSVTRPPDTAIRTGTSPNRVGTAAPVNVPSATRRAGAGVGDGVGVAAAVGAAEPGAGLSGTWDGDGRGEPA